MRAFLYAVALAVTGLAAQAQTPLSADEFEAHVLGKTVTYRQFAGIFGIEEYLPGRQVRWSVAENLCQYGTWYPKDEAICFVYEYSQTPYCWTFWLQDGALVALSVNDLPGAELYEVERNEVPLPCPGPDIGA